MRRIIPGALMVLFRRSLLVAASVVSKQPLNQAPVGYTNLFDGQTLAGWAGTATGLQSL